MSATAAPPEPVTPAGQPPDPPAVPAPAPGPAPAPAAGGPPDNDIRN